MSQVAEFVSEFFDPRDDLGSIVQTLDQGLLNVAVSVRMIRDMAVSGGPCEEAGSPITGDQIASSAEGVLAYLGRIGALVDALANFTEGFAMADRPTGFAPAGRA